jgi:uncharacterized membrane protein YdjX (TVP38/TMEM64 family)
VTALVLAALVLLAGLAFARSVLTEDFMDLERIRVAQEQLAPLYVLYFGYVLLCAVGVAVCLPVAAVMTAAGGALFGFAGFPLALLGTTAGSIIPFLISRKFGAPRLAKLDAQIVAHFRRGFARNASQFLILMRLLPWAPFSVTTIVAGAVEMPLAKFVVATALGSVPAGIALNAIGHGVVRVAEVQKISATDLLRQPEFLLLLGGIGGLVVLDMLRRHVSKRRMLD